jgi:hypothetical protein
MKIKDQACHAAKIGLFAKTHPVFASLDHPLCGKPQRGFTTHIPLSAEGKERGSTSVAMSG